MSVNRIKYRLNSTTSQTSLNTDTFVGIKLVGSERTIPFNDINATVNAAEVFNRERQACTKYRIVGTIKPIISNVLFNITGAYSWLDLNAPAFLNDPYDNPDTGRPPLTPFQSYDQNLKERDGWFGYYDPNFVASGSCEFITMEPKKERFSLNIDPNTGNKRWELTITYPWSADTTHDLIADNSGVTGLRITSTDVVNVGGRQVTSFTTPVRHNLAQGDRVRLRGLNPVTLDGDYTVVRVGTDNGSVKEYTFAVLIDAIPLNPNLISANTRMNRLVAGHESEYYIRLFKKVRTINSNINGGVIERDDYELYPAAFAQTIYRDEVIQFVVNEDVEVKGIRDNLGRPISEMYLTLIKTQDTIFTPIMVGLECGLLEGVFDQNVPDIRRLHTTGLLLNAVPEQDPFLSPQPLVGNVNINDSYYHGDVTEYNRYELIEYTLSVVAHRFNTYNRETVIDGTIPANKFKSKGPRLEGYFYYPHHKMKVRDFSNYVEQGDVNTYNIPDYAEDLGDGRWLWRDLLDIGINDGQYKTINYPFLNGTHYLYNNFCFPVRRQDPFGQYDLLYRSKPVINGAILTYAPYDVIGNGMTNQFTVNSVEDTC
jgi:hypothetical protein